MEHDHDNERTLSTADLADTERDGNATERGETGPAHDETATGRAASRELTDGRYDDTESRAAETGGDRTTPLLDPADTSRFRSEWDAIQTGFVDEPRRAVERADALVADLMQQLASSFAQERSQLEGQWDRGDDVSTEDLRVALQRYRSFFARLLNA